jgi:hypothetical protein
MVSSPIRSTGDGRRSMLTRDRASWAKTGTVASSTADPATDGEVPDCAPLHPGYACWLLEADAHV